jgi:hypothetical protein
MFHGIIDCDAINSGCSGLKDLSDFHPTQGG